VDNQNIPKGCLPFDLERACAGDPMVTRDGRTVDGFLFNARAEGSTYPCVVTVGDLFRTYTTKGKWSHDSASSEHDLFMVDTRPVPVAREVTSEPPPIPGAKDSDPVFPRNLTAGHLSVSEGGLNIRQHAAIALRVPTSGTPWLDDMIREARRLDASEAALQGWLATFGEATPNPERCARFARELGEALVATGGAA